MLQGKKIILRPAQLCLILPQFCHTGSKNPFDLLQIGNLRRVAKGARQNTHGRTQPVVLRYNIRCRQCAAAQTTESAETERDTRRFDLGMDLNAKAAYIRGMMKGMEFDPTTQEGKIIVAMMDLLEEMADVVSEHDDALDQAFDELDAIDEDMDDLVDNIFGDDDEDDDEDEDGDGAFETSYEVTCPNCGTVNIVDEDTLMDSDKIVCAECGAAFDVEVLPDDAEMPADAEAESTDVTIE